ncbi:MAG TPA: site-specific tyrosine recombinase XerD [Dehalococcoidia bacterium]|nr:site-specific tyrosine recombinase XerD [Dehalococcoidia bacterium]
MDQVIQRFLDYLVLENGVSENTRQAYQNDLNQFQRSLQADSTGEPRAWNTVTPADVRNFEADLQARKYAASSVARKIAAIRSFYKFLVGDGLVSSDPTENLASPKIGKSLPKALTKSEVDALLEQPARRTTYEAVRDKAMLELLYSTGMRVSELTSLNLDSVQIDGDGCRVRCVGKGSKERVVPFDSAAGESVTRYLVDARPALVRTRNERALFVNRRGQRLTRQGFWLILKNYAAAADIKTAVTPHTLRHSFATHMLTGGASVRNVQELLGHANISTTQVYTHLSDQHLRDQFERTHPRA